MDLDFNLLFEMLADARELIFDAWYFFLTVHLAILAIVYVAQRRTRFAERLILLAAYAGFMVMNYLSQADNYANYLLIVAQIKALASSNESASALLRDGGAVWLTTPQMFDQPILFWTYSAAGMLSAAVIIFINRRGSSL